MKKRVAVLITILMVLTLIPAASAATVDSVDVYLDGQYALQGKDYSGMVAISADDVKKLGLESALHGNQVIGVRKAGKTLIMTPGTNQAQLTTASGTQTVNLSMVPYMNGSEAYIPLQDVAKIMDVPYQRQGNNIYVGAKSAAKPNVKPQPSPSWRPQIERYQVTRNNQNQAQLNLVLDKRAQDVEFAVKMTKLSKGYRVEIALDDVKLSRSLEKTLNDSITIGKKQWFLNSLQGKNTANGSKITLHVDQKPTIRISKDSKTISVVLKK